MSGEGPSTGDEGVSSRPRPSANVNVWAIAFVNDGRRMAVLIRSNGEVTLSGDGEPFRTICLDGISFYAGN